MIYGFLTKNFVQPQKFRQKALAVSILVVDAFLLA